MLGWLLMFGATLYILAALKFAQMAYRAVIRAYPNLKIQDASANTLGWSSGVGIMRMVGRDEFLPKEAPEHLVTIVRKAKVAYWSCALAFVVFIVGMLIA